MYDCLHRYELCTAGADEIAREIRDLHNKDMKLSQVPATLARIKQLTGGLLPRQLSYFKMVLDVEELIKFLGHVSDKKFQETTEFLDAELQGYEFGLRVIGSLIVARKFLHPFVSRIALDEEYEEDEKEKKKEGKGDEKQAAAAGLEELTQLCVEVKGLLEGKDVASHKSLAAKLDEITRLPQHMPDIRLWFSLTSGTLSLDSILRCVSNHMKGYYTSRLAFHPMGEALILCEGDSSRPIGDGYMQYPASYVQDLIRRVVIFVSQANVNQEKMRELHNFVNIYKNARKIHALRLQLEASGHVDYQVRLRAVVFASFAHTFYIIRV